MLAGSRGFPDHHAYRSKELEALFREAGDVSLVTTPKDAVRLPEAVRNRIRAAGVVLGWDDPSAVEALLDAAIAGGGTPSAPNPAIVIGEARGPA